jgi:thiamine kinase-like enzyme
MGALGDAEDRIRALGLWSGPLSIATLAGGRSNESYRVEAGGEAFVVRFGADYPFHHVSRSREAMTARAAHEAGFAPEVLHVGPGVLVARFIAAKTWGNEDVQNDIDRSARLLRAFHGAMPRHVSGEARYFCPFHVIRDYARQLYAAKSRHASELAGYLDLANEMQAAQPPVRIVFGHNDLIPQNILDDGDRLWLIDFEYAGYSTPLFDLAGLASNARLSSERTEALAAAYLNRRPEPEIMRAISALQVASLLREAMWGMVSELHLNAPGVDYAAYAAECLEAMEWALDAYRGARGL